ncbi:UDP-GlcNAc:undecaprenyl-phosphate GlcNAc-1-phosphate transferase [Singulisphaera sp. GP187]|uniref:glycosyltransferase family 4 protein n=1 Tax=Singulisphaera sp. GP187 TaxID=1882752 RepID=UPI00092B580C|nr:MraY family glycosyltransferase [Singulisphaera sp. GP187]SIN92082.1 UDP-GlcNAc:undecaprenyl-phosphate GlcNAc-1-phosphate transferase [Singulisphaera sp. GP187]
MMISNSFLLIFAVAFMGCVLATPMVTRIAIWAGAIDRPDQFRRIHKGATPRLGGLGLAFGLASAIMLVGYGGYLNDWPGVQEWWACQWAVFLAGLIVLLVGFVDDTRSIAPRMKLAGQAVAVMILFIGGIRIQRFDILGMAIDLSHPVINLSMMGLTLPVSIPSLIVTMLWFLACMNIWNLIDGMDGLASGVGLLVSGTLTLVAIHNQNVGVAIMAAALAGSLAGFLLYNWHPACIFLGDSGSLLIGLLIGIIGVQGSLKGPSTISILFPILAMGLPISDTAMAIFRRWVRNLPLSSADRRHVHHLLIGLGLNPRQAALLLYCFSGFLCGAVLLGVCLKNEMLALILGMSGCLAFLLILTSRMDEFANLRGDFKARIARGRQERAAAKLTWEAIQRIELCEHVAAIRTLLESTAHELGCKVERVSCTRNGDEVFVQDEGREEPASMSAPLSGPSAVFRLSSGKDLLLTVSLHQTPEATTEADIAFRFLQRLSLATAERVERLLLTQEEESHDRGEETSGSLGHGSSPEPFSSGPRLSSQATPVLAIATSPSLTRVSLNWLRMTLRWSARPVVHHSTLGDK